MLLLLIVCHHDETFKLSLSLCEPNKKDRCPFGLRIWFVLKLKTAAKRQHTLSRSCNDDEYSYNVVQRPSPQPPARQIHQDLFSSISVVGRRTDNLGRRSWCDVQTGSAQPSSRRIKFHIRRTDRTRQAMVSKNSRSSPVHVVYCR